MSSQNLSTTSLSYNRELGVEVTTGPALTQLGRDFASDYAGAG